MKERPSTTAFFYRRDASSLVGWGANGEDRLGLMCDNGHTH